MKLWLKISLICASVLLLTVGVLSTMLLVTAKNQIVATAVQSAEAKQADLRGSFRQTVTLYDGRNDLGQIEKQSLVKYCFHSFASTGSVLLSGGETIYSNTGIDPAAYLPLAGKDAQAHCMTDISGMDYLIVGSRFDLLSQQFDVYVVRDITDVYQSISRLIKQFGAISAACIAAGMALVIVLTRYATKPLYDLGQSVKRIARGEYAERANAASGDEVGELARDFNRMAEAVQGHVAELQEVAQRQRLFIGGLTHEFKTPLTSVIGHAETLLYTDMPRDVVENSLLHIHEQCQWLERLTQKLLKLVTLGEGLDLREEPADALMDAVREILGDTLAKRGTPLEIESDGAVLRVDRDLMLSLLVNLVDNASKASKSGQAVRIRACENAIEVSDEGIGIPPEELPRVTEPFYMVDKSRSKQLGGVGLGLALVKRIADAHGARVSIKSEPGRGTTVRVRFPDNNTFTFP